MSKFQGGVAKGGPTQKQSLKQPIYKQKKQSQRPKYVSKIPQFEAIEEIDEEGLIEEEEVVEEVELISDSILDDIPEDEEEGEWGQEISFIDPQSNIVYNAVETKKSIMLRS